MTRLDRLELQVRSLRIEARAQAEHIVALEAALARRKREPAPKPDDADMTERDTWWAEYNEAEMLYGGGRVRLRKATFATRHGIPLSEFYRFFSRKDKRGIPKGSGPYQRIRTELTEAAAKLKASHGTARTSHIFSMKAAV